MEHPLFAEGNVPDSTEGGISGTDGPSPFDGEGAASVDGASPKKSSYNWGYTTSRWRYPLRLEPGFPG